MRAGASNKKAGRGPPGLDRPDQYRPAPAPRRFMLEPEPAPSERWVLPCMRSSFFAARNVPARSASAWHIKAPRLVWPNARLPGKRYAWGFVLAPTVVALLQCGRAVGAA